MCYFYFRKINYEVVPRIFCIDKNYLVFKFSIYNNSSNPLSISDIKLRYEDDINLFWFDSLFYNVQIAQDEDHVVYSEFPPINIDSYSSKTFYIAFDCSIELKKPTKGAWSLQNNYLLLFMANNQKKVVTIKDAIQLLVSKEKLKELETRIF